MTKYHQQKYKEEYRCPPYGYPPINYGKDIPPIEEVPLYNNKKDPLYS